MYAIKQRVTRTQAKEAVDDYAIDLEEGQKVLYRLLYNLSAKELKAFREYLDDALSVPRTIRLRS